MAYTEEEAKTKMCPYQMDVEDPAQAKCVGSDCMAFRWVPDSWRECSDQIIIVDKLDADLLVTDIWFDGRYPRKKDNRLHRIIAERAYGQIPEDMFVDHIDGDPLNNRRGNLRIVTKAQKAQNAANADTRGGSSRYRGVWKAKSGKWAAQIAKEGKRMSLGHYENEEDAAAAYDKAAEELHGEYARLNLVKYESQGRLGYCGLAGKE